MATTNLDVLRAIMEEVWNKGNMDQIEDYVASDFVGHSTPTDIHGPDGYKQFFLMLRSAFPDIHFTIESELSDESLIMGRWNATGTHLGEFMGIPPTANQVQFGGVTTGCCHQRQGERGLDVFRCSRAYAPVGCTARPSVASDVAHALGW